MRLVRWEESLSVARLLSSTERLKLVKREAGASFSVETRDEANDCPHGQS